jgi:CBS domain-containing protein
MREEKVSDVMEPSPATVLVSSTVKETALKMLDERVRELPVVDRTGRPVGVVRADDLSSIKGNTIEPGVRPAGLVLSKDISSFQAIRMMQDVRAELAVVVDGDRVIGTLNWADVTEKFADC